MCKGGLEIAQDKRIGDRRGILEESKKVGKIRKYNCCKAPLLPHVIKPPAAKPLIAGKLILVRKASKFRRGRTQLGVCGKGGGGAFLVAPALFRERLKPRGDFSRLLFRHF